MTERITLPKAKAGTFVSAGVVFSEGVAVVGALSSNRREFFLAKGATIETLADPERGLEDLTKGELIDFAFAQEPPITVKARARVEDIRTVIREELDARTAAEAERQAEVNKAAFDGAILAAGQQADSTIHIHAGDDGNGAPPAVAPVTPPASVE